MNLRIGRLLAGLVVVGLVAGCGGGAAPLASASSPSSNASSNATSLPTPTPSPAVAALFVAKLQAMSIRGMAVTGELQVDGATQTITGRYDSDGTNSVLTTTWTSAGVTWANDESTWAGKTYGRSGDAPWYEKTSPTVNDSTLGRVIKSVSAVADMGVVTKSGQQLHRLVPTGLTVTPADVGVQGTGTVKLAFFGLNDGTPVGLELTIDVTESSGAKTASMIGTLDFTFTPGASAVHAPDPVFVTLVSERGFSVGRPVDWDPRVSGNCEGFDGPGLEWLGACPYDKGSQTLTGRAAAVVSALKQQVRGEITANEAGELGGEPARIITYHYIADNGFVGFGIYVIAFHGTRGIDLTWESPIGNEDADAKTFGYVIDSFRFTS